MPFINTFSLDYNFSLYNRVLCVARVVMAADTFSLCVCANLFIRQRISI